jgi:hypothetical protein
MPWFADEQDRFASESIEKWRIQVEGQQDEVHGYAKFPTLRPDWELPEGFITRHLFILGFQAVKCPTVNTQPMERVREFLSRWSRSRATLMDAEVINFDIAVEASMVALSQIECGIDSRVRTTDPTLEGAETRPQKLPRQAPAMANPKTVSKSQLMKALEMTKSTLSVYLAGTGSEKWRWESQGREKVVVDLETMSDAHANAIETYLRDNRVSKRPPKK